MKASLNHKGLPTGSLQTFSRTYNAMPQAPNEGDVAVPSFNATFESADPVGSLGLVDEVVTLQTEYQTVEGTVKSVSASSGTNFVSIDATHVVGKLNTERNVMPIIKNGTTAIENAIYHWAQECGVFRHPAVGDMQIYIPSLDNSNIGWVTGTRERPFSRGNDIFNKRYWTLTNGGNYPDIRPTATQATLIAIHATATGVQTNFHFEPRYNDDETKNGRYMRVSIDANKNVVVEEWLERLASTVKVQGNLSPTGTSAAYPIYLLIERAGSQYRYSITTTPNESNPAPVVISQTHSTSHMGQGFRLLGISSDRTSIGAVVVSRANALPTQEIPTQINVRAGSVPFAPADQRHPDVIAGFKGNIWTKLKEAATIYDLDVDYTATGIDIRPREVKDFSASTIPKNAIRLSISSRDYADKVEVVCHKLKTDKTGGSTLLWKADSTYNLERGERQEVEIDAGATYTTIENPVPRTSFPNPYSWSYGSYVVWGNDGDVVNPARWLDDGGYVKVEPMEEAGKFKLILQAPNVASPQAPYKFSYGGSFDNPSIHIFGRGVKEEEKTYTIHTGAKDTGTEIGTTFTSSLISTPAQAFTIGARLSKVYGSAGLSISFSEPFQGDIVRGMNGSNFTYDGNVYRTENIQQNPREAQINAEAYNTVAEFGRIHGGKTLAEFRAEYAGKTLKDLSLHPFPRFIS